MTRRRHLSKLAARVVDRIPLVCLTHPFELGLGIALLATLVRGLLADQVTPSIDATLPELPRILYQAVSGLAGIGIVAGLISRDRWTPGRAVERAGLYLASGAFIGYALVLGGTAGGKAFVNVIVSVCIGLACLFRGIAIRRRELIELKVLTASNADREDGPTA